MPGFVLFFFELAGQPRQSSTSSGYQMRLVLPTVWHANLPVTEMTANILRKGVH